MRVLRRGTGVSNKKVEFECPHCESLLRAREDELTPFGLTDKAGASKKLLYYCPVCKTRHIIDRYKMIPVLKISDYIRLGLGKIADNELVYDDPDMREITYEY